ncbi:hypothetical protein ABS71_11630 [bacterium SCN 62-11]|nr:hypothetical protein [Candidatus Eremiobacteraeota bacterium]ODT66550.1 MAG: hypothetical protein ABS71_11630 [bacterium SCN 62-11]
MFSERGPGEPPETPQRLSLQSTNIRVNLEILGDQWREQVQNAAVAADPVGWAVWCDRQAYVPGQQVTVCGWVANHQPHQALNCELNGHPGRVDLTPEGAFLFRFPMPQSQGGPVFLTLGVGGSSHVLRLGVARGTADFLHDGAYLRIQAPPLAGQTAELQLQRLPIETLLAGAYDDFEFVPAAHARTQLREVFDAQGRLSIQCNSKTAGIFEVAGRVGDTSLYHRWLHLPEEGREGRRACKTMAAFDQVMLTRFGQALEPIQRVEIMDEPEPPALGMDLDPPGPFAPGDQAVLRIALNGSPSATGFLCWSEGRRLVSWGVVQMREGLNGLLAPIPTDAHCQRMTLSLHLMAGSRRLEAQLGVVIVQPGIRFACEWGEQLTVRVTDGAGHPLPQTTVLGRVVKTTWAEQQTSCCAQLFPQQPLPFQVLPVAAAPTPARNSQIYFDCAGSSDPSWSFLGRSDGEGKVVWAAQRSPGYTVHLIAQDIRGAWVESFTNL